MSHDQVRVNVDRTTVRIRGVRNPPSGMTARRLHRMEISFGPFDRSVQIPVSFESDLVTASLDGGFLEITIPKTEPGKKRVEVDVE